MVSPPMENGSRIPPWQRSQTYGLSDINPANIRNSAPYFAMSSYLEDDRSTETPAPIPIECHLGPDTPSPSLPSSSPPANGSPSDNSVIDDTSELMRMIFADDIVDGRKRRAVGPDGNPIKRGRRTNAQIAADRQAKINESLKNVVIDLEKTAVTKDDMSIRLFFGSSKCEIKKNLPRVPRMKLTPTNFQQVGNIGYMKTSKGIALSCMTACKFKTYDPDRFRLHLMTHEKEALKEPCALCRVNFVQDSDSPELKHMLDSHVLVEIQNKTMVTHEVLHSKVLPIISVDDEEPETVMPSPVMTTPELSPEYIPEQESDDSNATIEYPLASKSMIIASISDGSNGADSGIAGDEITIKESFDQELARSSLDDDEIKQMESALDDLFDIIPDVEETEDVALTPQIDNDSDFDPNAEVETDEEPVSDTAVTSDEDQTRSEISETSSDEEFFEDVQPLSPPMPRQSSRHRKEKSHKHKRKSREEKRRPEVEEKLVEKLKIVIDRRSLSPIKTRKASEEQRHRSMSQEKHLHKKEMKTKDARKKNRKRRRISSGEDSDEPLSNIASTKPAPKLPKFDMDSSSNKDTSSEDLLATIVSRNNGEKSPSELPENENAPANDASNKESIELDFLHAMPLSLMEKIKQARESEPDDAIAKKISASEIVRAAIKPFESTVESVVENVIEMAVEKPMVAESSIKLFSASTSEMTVDEPPAETAVEKSLKMKIIATRAASSRKFEILEDIVIKSKSKRKKKIDKNTPTARKSTSRVSKAFKVGWEADEKSFFKLERKKKPTARKSTSKISRIPTKLCSINLTRVECDKQSFRYIDDSNDPFTMMIDTNPIPQTLESQSSDEGRREIDYEETNEILDINPPIAMKDFPAVMDDSIIELPATAETATDMTKEKNSDKETDDEFFDSLESLEATAILETFRSNMAKEKVNEKASASATTSTEVDTDEMTEDDVIFVEISDLPPFDPDDKTVPKNERRYMNQLYPWIDESITKQWYKRRSRAKDLLKEESLFSSYKCMSRDCTYYTMSLKKFREHLDKHFGQDEYFVCSFCLVDEKEPDDLRDHLIEYHTFDRYQCSKCMYRASEKFYCDIHRKTFHPTDNKDNQQTSIYKVNCFDVQDKKKKTGKTTLKTDKNSLRSPTVKERSECQEKLEDALLERVNKFECPLKRELNEALRFFFRLFLHSFFWFILDCKKSFYLQNDYAEHLQEESDSTLSGNFNNLICNEITRMHSELSKITSDFGAYKCLYDECSDGFNDIGEFDNNVHRSLMINKKLLIVVSFNDIQKSFSI